MPDSGSVRSIDRLLQKKYVTRGLHVQQTSEQDAPWSMAQLQGQLVYLGTQDASAQLTAAMVLVLDAQRSGEIVAWITAGDRHFYPPDAAASGVDLRALAVVRLNDAKQMLTAADKLIRSSGFGLVVIDVASLYHCGDGWSRDGVMHRLSALLRKHASVAVLLGHRDAGQVSSNVSLWVQAETEGSCDKISNISRIHSRGMRSVQIFSVRQKGTGSGWTRQESCCGPDGMC